eukprot:CAMPEP_0119376442 /NCGR_PEP_ID=MMETSP1334-20130426/40079_1 /TAXON_ID=127549 /ORGANISM="Calcidiscus leptoporus, Strain RCC1130" /LENGTH=274 /DNA_ID=CAMNT_0007395003 /DNA_START=410 /DNA_END=1235 /DNA_ORIENTATION=-
MTSYFKSRSSVERLILLPEKHVLELHNVDAPGVVCIVRREVLVRRARVHAEAEEEVLELVGGDDAVAVEVGVLEEGLGHFGHQRGGGRQLGILSPVKRDDRRLQKNRLEVVEEERLLRADELAMSEVGGRVAVPRKHRAELVRRDDLVGVGVGVAEDGAQQLVQHHAVPRVLVVCVFLASHQLDEVQFAAGQQLLHQVEERGASANTSARWVVDVVVKAVAHALERVHHARAQPHSGAQSLGVLFDGNDPRVLALGVLLEGLLKRAPLASLAKD